MDKEWADIVKKKFGFGPEHLNFSHTRVTLASWDEPDVKDIIEKPKTMLQKLDKIWSEIANNPKTTIKPKQVTVKMAGMKRMSYQEIMNILPTTGLEEMAKRGTNEQTGANGTTHGAVGDDGTAEQLTDTTLGNELVRKEFDVAGTRQTENTTERYGLAFSRTDFAAGPDPVLREAGLFVQASGGAMISRVTAEPITVVTGRVVTYAADITHANGIEV